MSTLTQQERVSKYLSNNPWSTRDDIAKGAEVPPSNVSAILSHGVLRTREYSRIGTYRNYQYAISSQVLSSTTTTYQMPPSHKTEDEVKTAVPSLEDAVNSLAEMLVEKVVERASQLLAPKLEEIVEEILTRISSNKITSSTQPKPSLPRLQKILVVGLLPEQANLIREEFQECFDIRFWKNGNYDTLRQLTKTCDKVILMSQFVSHSQQNNIKNAGVVPVICHGGLSSLRETLTDLYVQA